MAVTLAQKQEFTRELLGYEAQKDLASANQLATQVKNFVTKLQGVGFWDDSRGSTSASFLNLINDTSDNKEYFTSTELKERARALLVYLSQKLTPAEAQSLNLQAYQRVSASTAAENLATTQRLSQPGGMFFETARELPDPLIDETKKRAGQAKEVGASVAEKLQPAGSSLKRRLDAEGWTNPLILLTMACILIFVKNKMLAAAIDGILLYIMFKTGFLTITLPSLS